MRRDGGVHGSHSRWSVANIGLSLLVWVTGLLALILAFMAAGWPLHIFRHVAFEGARFSEALVWEYCEIPNNCELVFDADGLASWDVQPSEPEARATMVAAWMAYVSGFGVAFVAWNLSRRLKAKQMGATE